MPTSIPLRATPRLRAPLSLVFGALIASGVQAAELPEVTVSAPSLKTFGRDATGAQIQQATASARIRYNPIMLTTNSGRALLNDKVAEVARGLCRKLDIVTVVGTEDESTCVQRAVTGAKVQIAVAISRQKVS